MLIVSHEFSELDDMTSFAEYSAFSVFTKFIVIYDDRATYISLEMSIVLYKKVIASIEFFFCRSHVFSLK